MGPGGFFPTNPDLADILGRTDFDFEILFTGGEYFFGIPKFQISRFPDFQKSGLGQAWAGPGFNGPWAGWALGWAGPRKGPRVGLC